MAENTPRRTGTDPVPVTGDGAAHATATGNPPAQALPADPAAASRIREQSAFERKLSADDTARAKAKKVTLMAVVSFTIFGEEDHPEGRVVNQGEEFEVSEFDLPRYIGKGHPKVEVAGIPAGGVNVSKAP